MSPLVKFILRRFIQLVPMLLAVVILNFLLIHAAPGDPTYILVGEVADEKFVQEIRRKFGLDRPLHEQLFIYIIHVMRGDLGFSALRGTPVINLILERIPATLILIATAMLFAVSGGMLLGVVSAVRRGAARSASIIISTLGVSIPTFWLGQILLLLFSVHLGLFPLAGMRDVRANYEGLAYLLDVMRHLFLPAVTLGTFHLAFTTRLTGASMLEVLRQDFVTLARSKGIPERAVIIKHVLRNALIPVTTYTGLTIGVLFTGAILTESVYAWPGMGSLLYTSLRLRDYPTILGIFVFVSIIVAIANLIVDILYGILDPRVRVG